jgi:hypothetical protein
LIRRRFNTFGHTFSSEQDTHSPTRAPGLDRHEDASYRVGFLVFASARGGAISGAGAFISFRVRASNSANARS